MPDNSYFNFPYDAQTLMAEGHALDDVNPSQRPGTMLYTAYQINLDELTLSASSLPPVIPSNNDSDCFHQHNSTPTLDSTEKECLIAEATSAAFLTLYQHNELEVQVNDAKVWELQCPHGCWIKSGIRSHIKLTSRGQFMALEQHYGACCIQKSKVRGAIKKSRLALATLNLSKRSSIILSPSSSPPASAESAPNSTLTLIAPSPCPGFVIHDWPTPDGIPAQANLPWLRTADGPDKLSFDLEVVSHQILAHSFNCTRVAVDDARPCDFCAYLELKVNALADNARTHRAHTRHGLLTPIQLIDVIHECDHNFNVTKLQGLNNGCKIRHLLSRLEDHSSLVIALSQCDIPWLCNLLQTALKNGASIRTILRMLEDTLEQGNLLYSLNQCLNLPSLCTLQRKTSFVNLHPIIGPISGAVIECNINDVVIVPRAEAQLTLRGGVSLLIDETALEESVSYMSDSNSVGGLCWMHSHNIDPTLRTYHSALNLAEALKEGKVHLGRELTVIAAHIFGADGTYPILAAPTCKSEGATEMIFIFKTAIDAWKASGAEEKVGPLWSFATDGDATQQKGGHQLFLSVPLPFTSPLYGTLSNLPGLNLLTGDCEIMLDFDYKHVFKRFSTVLRSHNGIHLNNGRCINSTMLHRYLTWVNNINEKRATALLYPDDPQDVPRAVELMSAIIVLGSIDPTKILSHVLDSLLQPFIKISLSLMEQVISLSRFVHLLYACYHNQRHSFIPNQLYYDSQTLFKNIIFCISKQQQLDPNAIFSLLDVGDDPIELLFAFLRMCGGHNSAINYKQSLDRLGAAHDIGGVYARNPDIMRGPRCLNLSHSEALDHISRSTWKGDVISGHCDLQSSWKQGRDEAVQILQDTWVPTSAYNFAQYFSVGSGIDLLCVFGEGKYPSMNDGDDDKDRSILAPPILSSPREAEPHDIEEALPLQGCASSPIDVDGGEDYEHTFEEILEDVCATSPDQPEEDNEESADTAPSSAAPPTGPGVPAVDFLWCDKKWVHKQSVCRLIISPDFTPKSQSRLFRVRGFLPVNKRSGNVEAGNFLHGDHFLTGDLFLALLRTHSKTLALALLQATAISENGTSCARIKTDTLISQRANIKVSGEVMVLVPSRNFDSDSTWVWTGGYLKTASAVPGMSINTQKVVSISIPGYLLNLVNPSVVNTLDALTTDQTSEINSQGSTWALDNEALQMAVASLWTKIEESKIPFSSITSLSTENSHFPYKMGNGVDGLICGTGTEILASTGRGKAVTVSCPVCSETTKDICSHMGMHILRAARKVFDNVVDPISGPLPCRFCGQSNNPDCALLMKETSHKIQWESKCPCQDAFQYGSASKGSDTRPCRNVPIVCQLCIHQNRDMDWLPALWHYNFEAHLNLEHPEYAHPGKLIGLPLPGSIFQSFALTAAKEKKAGVPVRPVFTLLQKEKENTPVPAHSKKRKANAQAFVSAATLTKRVRQ
ncbi:hypothetical protein BD769DRAFT_1679203 [Suillus cothurnatus]|nr:hypothetical protein BD769DRAFT_1679203 [Suillus cothurnatus]